MSLPQVPVSEQDREPIAAWITRHRVAVGLTIVVLSFHLFAFYILCSTNSWDHGPHIQAARDLIVKHKWLSYFLYHLSIAVLAGWSSNAAALSWAATWSLTLAVVARYWISYAVLDPEQRRPARAVAFSVALLFAMPLWNWWKFPKVYLGQVTPNCWHNPTITFAMPFAVGLFFLAVRYLRRPNRLDAILVAGLLIVSTLAKPNYVLAFGPCLALLLAGRAIVAVHDGWKSARRVVLDGLVIFLPVAAVLSVQFVTTFGKDATDHARIVVAPLVVWSLYSPNVPASILLGIAFPLLVALLYPRLAWTNLAMRLAWAVLAVAIAQFALFGEEGRMGGGNFAWGCYMADYVLFLLSCRLLMSQRIDWRFVLAALVLCLHAISGGLHLYRYLIEPIRTIVPD